MTQVMHRAKWLIPLIVIVAMLAAVGIVWGTSGGSDGGGFVDTADFNPVYDDQLVVPSEAEGGLLVLYSLAIDPTTSTIPSGSGAIATVTLTNLIEGPLVNGTKIANEVVTQNGDLTGNLVVTADVYNVLNPCGCLTTYDTETSWLMPTGGFYYGLAGECYADAAALATAAGMAASVGVTTPTTEQQDFIDSVAAKIYASPAGAGNYVPNGLPSGNDVVIKVYPDITVHPGGTVTFQVLVAPGDFAPVGANFMIKAEFLVTAGP